LRNDGTSGLELGFDQRHKVPVGLQQPNDPRRCRSQRDEGQVGHDEGRGLPDEGPAVGLRTPLRGEVTNVAPLDNADPIVGAQTLVYLAMSNVEGDDLRSTSLQQTVGESAGGRTHIDRAESRRVESERIEGRLQLQRTPAHVSRRWGGHGYRFTDGYEPPRFVSHSTAHANLPQLNVATRNLPGFGEATSNHFDVESSTQRRH
jgi:hypothetical protein